MDRFLEKHLCLITDVDVLCDLQECAPRFANAVRDKTDCLFDCVGFIDGTVISIARPGEDAM